MSGVQVPYRPPFRTISRTFRFFQYNFELTVLLQTNFPDVYRDNRSQSVCIVLLHEQIGKGLHPFDELNPRLVILIIKLARKTFYRRDLRGQCFHITSARSELRLLHSVC